MKKLTGLIAASPHSVGRGREFVPGPRRPAPSTVAVSQFITSGLEHAKWPGAGDPTSAGQCAFFQVDDHVGGREPVSVSVREQDLAVENHGLGALVVDAARGQHNRSGFGPINWGDELNRLVLADGPLGHFSRKLVGAAVFGPADEAGVDHSQRLGGGVLACVKAALDGVKRHENEDSGE